MNTVSLIHSACVGCGSPAPASPFELLLAGLVALMPLLVLGMVVILVDRYGT